MKVNKFRNSLDPNFGWLLEECKELLKTKKMIDNFNKMYESYKYYEWTGC